LPWCKPNPLFIEVVRKRKETWIRRLPKYGCILLLLFVVAAGVYFAWHKYRRFNQAKLIASTNAFVEAGDLRSAWLTAQQALQLNPSNPQVCRLMAQIADLAESSESILWWSRVAQLENNRLQSLLPLATAAMHFKEMGIAEEALGLVRKQDRDTVAYHQSMAAFCVLSGQLEEAEKHFERAVELQPLNETLQLDLAGIRLQSDHPETVALARKSLEQLRQNPKVHLAVLRALSSDARKRGALDEAHHFAEELIVDPACNFQDQLLYLDALKESALPTYAARLANLQTAAEGKPDLINQMIRWMNARGLQTEALTWVRKMPTEYQRQAPIQMAAAECLVSLKRHRTRQARCPSTASGNRGGPHPLPPASSET